MRSETDKFEHEGDVFYAERSTLDSEICLNIDKTYGEYYGYLTKQQAAQFARQPLEMCGGGE